MADLEKRLEEKLKYLKSMEDKYLELNRKTNFEYEWRIRGLEDQILILEELRDNHNIYDWDECYKEDLEEAKLKYINKKEGR